MQSRRDEKYLRPLVKDIQTEILKAKPKPTVKEDFNGSELWKIRFKREM